MVDFFFLLFVSFAVKKPFHRSAILNYGGEQSNTLTLTFNLRRDSTRPPGGVWPSGSARGKSTG
jgi:hypothetical protein